MNHYEFKFYVSKKIKNIKIFSANTYGEAFSIAHEFADNNYKSKAFVEIACKKL